MTNSRLIALLPLPLASSPTFNSSDLIIRCPLRRRSWRLPVKPGNLETSPSDVIWPSAGAFLAMALLGVLSVLSCLRRPTRLLLRNRTCSWLRLLVQHLVCWPYQFLDQVGLREA